MVFNDILNQILAANPKLDRDNLLLMIERKKEDSHGLLSDEGAIRLVAQQLSIIPLSNIGLKDQRIRSVQAGLNDVTITGAIIALSEPYEFDRSDGSHGKLLRLRLTDGSGELTCVFWDSNVDLVIREALSPGCQLRVLHGYTKNGQAGEVEFHLGSKSSFQILSRKSLQDTVSNHTTHSESAPDSFDRLKLCILRLQKGRSENGPTWGLCHGEAGLMIGKFWDEHAENILKFKIGSWLEIEQPSLDERNGIMYVNIGSKSTLNKLDNMELGPVYVSTNIKLVKPRPFLWTISGRVIETEEVREVRTKEGRKVKVSNLSLEDDTGKIRISCWDSHAEEVSRYRIGESIRMVGVKVRQSMNGETDASTVFLTSIDRL